MFTSISSNVRRTKLACRPLHTAYFEHTHTSMANIWIGNLQPSATEASVSELLSQYGTVVSSKVLSSAKGTCGMVQLDTPEAAQRAVAGLNGQDFEGQSLICRPARSDKRAPPPASPAPVVYHTATPQLPPKETGFKCNVWCAPLSPRVISSFMQADDIPAAHCRHVFSFYHTHTHTLQASACGLVWLRFCPVGG